MPTNFLQWNPTEANQESDSEYSADTFRADGAVGGIFPAETGNKLFYQVAAFCAAYATMMANKGYTVNDSPFSTLVSVLSNVVTNADQRGELQIMTYSPAEACDASKYLGFQIPLNGNVTVSLSGQNMGDEIAFIFVQDATGGRTVTWPSTFHGFFQPTTTANSISVQFGKVTSDLSVYAAATDISGAVPGSYTQANITIDEKGRVTAASNGSGTSGFTSGSNVNGNWEKNPIGTMQQWGSGHTNSSGHATVTFPTPFLTLYKMVTTVKDNVSHTSSTGPNSSLSSNSVFTWNEANDPVSTTFDWHAIGN
jgi:hypothetical protein